jgi:hypothetical protein
VCVCALSDWVTVHSRDWWESFVKGQRIWSDYTARCWARRVRRGRGVSPGSRGNGTRDGSDSTRINGAIVAAIFIFIIWLPEIQIQIVLFHFFWAGMVHFSGAKKTKDRRTDTVPQHQERMPETQLRRARPPARPLLQSLSRRRSHR